MWLKIYSRMPFIARSEEIRLQNDFILKISSIPFFLMFDIIGNCLRFNLEVEWWGLDDKFNEKADIFEKYSSSPSFIKSNWSEASSLWLFRPIHNCLQGELWKIWESSDFDVLMEDFSALSHMDVALGVFVDSRDRIFLFADKLRFRFKA